MLVGALDAYGVSRQPLQTALYEAAEAARAKKVDATAELIEGTPGNRSSPRRSSTTPT